MTYTCMIYETRGMSTHFQALSLAQVLCLLQSDWLGLCQLLLLCRCSSSLLTGLYYCLRRDDIIESSYASISVCGTVITITSIVTKHNWGFCSQAQEGSYSMLLALTSRTARILSQKQPIVRTMSAATLTVLSWDQLRKEFIFQKFCITAVLCFLVT